MRNQKIRVPPTCVCQIRMLCHPARLIALLPDLQESVVKIIEIL